MCGSNPGEAAVILDPDTGTQHVVPTPDPSLNLACVVWSPVPSYTNTFANGTNTTVFERLDPICGPNVFLRISQHDIRVTQSGEGQDSEAALVYIGRIIERDPE